MKILIDNQQIKTEMDKYSPVITVHTIEVFYSEMKYSKEEAQEKIKKSIREGNSQAWTNRHASVLTADYKGKAEVMRKKKEAYQNAILLLDGELVTIRGIVYKVKYGNINCAAPIHFMICSDSIVNKIENVIEMTESNFREMIDTVNTCFSTMEMRAIMRRCTSTGKWTVENIKAVVSLSDDSIKELEVTRDSFNNSLNGIESYIPEDVDAYPPFEGGFIARGQKIVAAWERRAEERQLIEAGIPKLSPVEAGHMAHLHYRENVDIMMEGR